MKYTFEELRTIAEELNASLPMKENGEEVGVDDYSSDRPEELAEAVLRAFEENIPQNREDEVPDSVLEFYMEMVPQEEIVDLEKEEKEEEVEEIEEVRTEEEEILEEKEDKRKVIKEMANEEMKETVEKICGLNPYRVGSSAYLCHQAILDSGKKGISYEDAEKLLAGKVKTTNLKGRIVRTFQCAVKENLAVKKDGRFYAP